MQIVGFYCSKAKKGQKAKIKEIQIDVNKVLMKAAVTLILCNGMTTTVWAGPIAESVQPIIDVLKDLAEPISYGFMIKGFMKIMAGDEHEGWKTIKYAVGGYLGIQWIPSLYKLFGGIRF